MLAIFVPPLNSTPRIQDVAHLLVRSLPLAGGSAGSATNHSARARVLVEDGDVVAERSEVARDGERRGPGADAGDALAVFFRGGFPASSP